MKRKDQAILEILCNANVFWWYECAMAFSEFGYLLKSIAEIVGFEQRELKWTLFIPLSW